MKRIILVMLIMLCVFPLDAQKVHSTLENPQMPELALKYSKYYNTYMDSYILIDLGLGLTATGAGFMLRTSSIMNDYEGEVGGGAAVVLILEGAMSLYGVLLSLGGLGMNVGSRAFMNKLSRENDFLSSAGEDLDSWNRYRASAIYESSRKWKKASGITAACSAACFVGGLLGSANTESDFLSGSAEVFGWIALASSATFLLSSAVNVSAKSKLEVNPVVVSLPLMDRPVVGLGLAARF